MHSYIRQRTGECNVKIKTKHFEFDKNAITDDNLILNHIKYLIFVNYYFNQMWITFSHVEV